jgi:hypothetical protein
MKIIKGLPIFSILVVLFGSCFTPPEISSTPQISGIGLEDLAFIVTPDPAQQDTLAITINFKDGDGDLGLDPVNPEHNSAPFNEFNYFLESNGTLINIPTNPVYSNLPPLIDVPQGVTGKLATVRTRKKTGYENLPGYTFPATCLTYYYGKVYIDASHKDIFDATYNLDSIMKGTTTSIYVLLDTFYYETNPNHYNIDVDFLVKSPKDPNADSEGFVVFDWRVETGKCSSNQYGRFPVLSQKLPRPLEGTLRYSMKSGGFLPLLGSKTLKLQIRIRDRALNVSNTIRTKEFTLTQIRR